MLALATIPFAFAGRPLHEPPSNAATPVAEPAAAAAGVTAPTRRDEAGVDAGTAEPSTVSLCTFADGRPVPSLVEDVSTVATRLADWSAAKPRHEVPATGSAFAVISRDCLVAVVRRSELPQHGEHRVDLTPCPVLDVRLTNVPAGIRDRLDLMLQLEYENLDAAERNASCATGRRRPLLMAEDRVLMPLVLLRPGRLVLHAQSRHSMHSYPTPKVAFEPVSQVIELDLTVLAPACSLADLSLTLRFPYAHPDGELDLSLLDLDGSTMLFQRRVRGAEKQLEYRFRDLPARVQPLLQHTKGGTAIHLPPIDLRAGDNAAVLDVVAESSLRVVLSGRDGLAADGVSVLLCTEDGDALAGQYPEGNETRFEHLPATTLFVQAIAYEARRCSPVARVTLGVAQAHEVALHLVPGGQVHVASGGFGAAVRRLDVDQPGHGQSPIGMRPGRRALFWLPLGDARVTWVGGSRTLHVEPGVINRWP